MGDTESPEAAANEALRRKLLSLPDSDAGNAEAFELLHGSRFRFDRKKGLWLVWNDGYWQADERGEAERAALRVARLRRYVAASISDHKEAERRIRWALNSEGVRGIAAMLESARSIESLATITPDYDRNPFLLTVGNGTLDLRTGGLRSARPEDLITRATSVPYNPAADCLRWLQFLKEIFPGDTELVDYIQRAAGYSLTGDTTEQCFFVLFGSGANGKTSLLEILVRLLGTHAATTPFDTFLVRSNPGAPRNDLAALHGARFVKAAEAEHRARLDEALVKQVTGEDTVTARFLFREHFSFKPQFKIWLATNYKPDIRGTDYAIWRRVVPIPFTQEFRKDDPRTDSHLREKLAAELEGILAWAVRGCLAWQKYGLGTASAIESATREYRQESDQVGRFIKGRCVREAGRQTGGKKFYDDYVHWCAQHGEKPLANNIFAQELKKRGISKKQTRSGVFYEGIGLLPETSVALLPRRRDG
jgi:putative DNA primase/helicase